MSEVQDYFENAQLSARQANVAALDDDPEQAARAVDLAESSGVPSTAIYGDLDGFERSYKAALGSSIINENAYIADYLNSHPMAPRISHDDLGVLDDASRSILGLQGETRLQQWLKSDSVSRSFLEGWGEQPFGQQMFQRPQDVEWALSHPAVASIAGAASMPLEFMTRATGGLVHLGHDALSQMFGKSFADDMAALAEYSMMRGDMPAHMDPLQQAMKSEAKGQGVSLPPEWDNAAKTIKQVSDGLQIADQYTRAGLEPPVGLHPLIDEAKKLQAKEDIDALDDALTNAVKSATRERSPEFFANFVRSHLGDREIGIDGEAIRRLYGERTPTNDDNLLGWIPDLDQRLIGAEGTGGDVRVPVADWLAKVDPEVAKELHDDIRVRDNGMTINEGKIEAEPKEVIAEPVASTRGSAGLEPLASVGDRKVQLQKLDSGEEPKPGFENFHDFDMLDENGNRIGSINLSKQGSKLYIEMINAGANRQMYQPNFLGPSLIRDIKRQLKSFFPDADTITGHRVSGAREKAGTWMDKSAMPVVKLGAAEDPQSFRDLLQAHWEEPYKDVAALFQTDEKGLAANSPLGQIVLSEIRRIAPTAEADIAHGLAIRGQKAYGAYLPDMKQIIISLEAKDAFGTAGHEAIHALRDMQLFSADEWRTLEAASLEHGWVKKYKIDTRYASQSREIQHEESIAHAYQDWRRGAQMPEGVHGLFERVKQFFQGVLDRVNEFLGTKHDTWEDVFKRVESGEVGGRETPEMEAARLEGGHEPFDPKASIEQFRRGANENRRNIGDPRIGPVEQLARKLAEGENGKGSWDRIGGGGQEHYWRDAERFLKQPRPKDWDTPVYDRAFPKQGPKASFEEPEGDEKGIGLYDRAQALGITQAHMDRMLRLIEKRNAEDLEAAQRRAEVKQRRLSNKELKARRVEIRDEVAQDMGSRPDIATDQLFAKGGIKLHPDFLSEDQKARLPKDYIQKKDGVSPDDLAPYFGYTSGDALVERLGMLTEDRRRSGMSSRDYLNRLIDVETDRRLNAEYGNREQSILDAAKDQALSETQLNLVHEETLAYALKAGQEPQFTKEQTREMVRQVFDQTPVGQISSDRLLQTAGKVGKKIEEAASAGKWGDAYRLSQQRNHAVIAAKLAREYERARASVDRLAKTYRKREVPSVPAEYTNWIHDIIQRVGYPVNRSVQDLAENIGRQPNTTLEDFRDAKESEWLGLRELPVADFLLDPAFRKPVDELSHRDFMGLKSTLDSLVKAGRDEFKIYREGEVADRAVVLQQMRDKLATFPMKDRGAMGKAPGLLRLYTAASTNIETILNRWDRDDPRGIFNRYIIYPLAKASNYKNVLEREMAKALRELGPIKDKDKLVDSPITDPLTRTEANPDGSGSWTGFSRSHVMAMLQNAGNKSNWTVLARGYGAEPDALMQWLFRNTTKEDWDRAQKMGDTVFKDLVKKADGVYERLTGATIEKIPLEPVQTPYGDYAGWYHPLIRNADVDTVWEKDPDTGLWSQRDVHVKSKIDNDFFHYSTANGYTKKRTGATYPLELNFDRVPARIRQMIHDIAFRETLHEVQKVFDNGPFRDAVSKHYGTHYKDLLMPYLKDMAGAEGIASRAQGEAARISEYLRQNTISTLIGFNPYTAMKHGLTALVMSSRQVGTKDFARAVASLYGKSPEQGLRNSEFAMKYSEELQRRERHWQDTISGEAQRLEGNPNLRERIIEKGSWLVAQSDMLSAKPTWLAAYNKAIASGDSHGAAIELGDRAVRFAHGSTAVTNQPALVRGGGPLHGWLTSVYGFFGTNLQRRVEIAHQLNDAFELGVKQGEFGKAAGKLPGIAADIMTYVVWPTVVEEAVTGLTTDDRRGWGYHLAAGAGMGLASSWLYLRDLMHAAATGQDPGAGLVSSPLHDFSNVLRQYKKGLGALDRRNAGKTVADTLTLFGDMTGMAPKTIDNAARFGIDLVNKQAHPKGAMDVFRGLTRGTEKRRIEK